MTKLFKLVFSYRPPSLIHRAPDLLPYQSRTYRAPRYTYRTQLSMATATLNPLPLPIGIFPSCIATSSKTMVVTLLNGFIDAGRWVAGVVAPGLPLSSESATNMFTLGGKYWFRKPRTLYVKNMEGAVIFRLKHNISYWRETFGKGCKWRILAPEGSKYRSVGSSVSSKSKTWDTGIDLNIENLAGDGRPVTIHIHQPNANLDQYQVTVDGVVVARAARFKAEPQSKFSS
jgi:hypothetical protein